jgi:adenosylhomocysteine nucleosidase
MDMSLLNNIAIFSATEHEQQALLAALTQKATITIDGCTVIKGLLDGTPCTISQTGVGQVNAAIHCTSVIKAYRPSFIIFCAIAGSLQPDVKLNDVVISDDTLSTEMLTLDPNFNKEAADISFASLTKVRHTSSLQLAKKIVDQLKDYSIKLHAGLIACSDYFPAPPYLPDQYYQQRILAVDMESAAVAQTCNRFDVPFLIVRGMSNFVYPQHGDATVPDDHITSSANMATEVTRVIIKDILPTI